MRLLLHLFLVIVLAGCAKDLRPRDARTWGATPPAAAETRGRALLAAAAEAHGFETWRTLDAIELDLVDTWNVGLFRSMMTPLKDPTTALTYRFVVGSGFWGEGVITSGDHAGDRFGVRGTPGPDSYVVVDGEERARGGMAAKIYAPSVQYFTELPFRLLEADTVAFVGQVDWRGRAHDRVLATWGGLRPHMGHDQYVVYLDAEDHTLSVVRYTVRSAGPPMASAMVFEDLREVDGMRLPFVQRVGFFGDDDVREIHRLDVKAVRTVPRAASPAG